MIANDKQVELARAAGRDILKRIERLLSEMRGPFASKESHDMAVGQFLLSATFSALEGEAPAGRVNRLSIVGGLGMALGATVAQQTPEDRAAIIEILDRGYALGAEQFARDTRPVGNA